jgi:hypothetical protein
VPGGTRPIPIFFAQTEAKGVFSFHNVPPGEYFVRAYAAGTITPTRARASSYISTYFPEANDVTFAQPLVLGGGQELTGVDFPLMTATMLTVSGRLVDPAGASMATARVHLMQRPGGAMDDLRAQVTADGRFRFVNVQPGDYMLTIGDTADTRSWNNAVRDIAVTGDVTDLTVVAGPSVFVDGRVVSDTGRPLPFDPGDVQLVTEQRVSALGIHAAGFAKVASDGTFSMRSGAGTLSLRVAGLPPRWFVKSMRLDGTEVIDAAFDLTPGDRRRFEITLSDRVSRLAGAVTDRSARPVSNALVVIFPDDRARWNNPRSIRTTFSHQQGRYEIDALPIASYRVVAVTALPRDAWTDPDVLARLWPSASSISLDELGQGTLNLKVVSPPTDLIQ